MTSTKKQTYEHGEVVLKCYVGQEKEIKLKLPAKDMVRNVAFVTKKIPKRFKWLKKKKNKDYVLVIDGQTFTVDQTEEIAQCLAHTTPVAEIQIQEAKPKCEEYSIEFVFNTLRMNYSLTVNAEANVNSTSASASADMFDLMVQQVKTHFGIADDIHIFVDEGETDAGGITDWYTLTKKVQSNSNANSVNNNSNSNSNAAPVLVLSVQICNKFRIELSKTTVGDNTCDGSNNSVNSFLWQPKCARSQDEQSWEQEFLMLSIQIREYFQLEVDDKFVVYHEDDIEDDIEEDEDSKVDNDGEDSSDSSDADADDDIDDMDGVTNGFQLLQFWNQLICAGNVFEAVFLEFKQITKITK